MRGYRYRRISIGDQGRAVERQLDRMSREIDRIGAQVIADFIDEDVKATRERPAGSEFRALLSRLERGGLGKGDVVFATSVDRLGRNFTEMETLEKLAREFGFNVYITELGRTLDFDDPEWVDRVARAKTEAMVLRKRVRDTLQFRVDRGYTANGGVRPFGYNSTRTDIAPDEAKAIEYAAKWILDGKPITKLVDKWNRDGEPKTVKGGPWSVRTLSGILKSPRIAGLLEHRGKLVGPGNWPAILDMETWETVTTKLSRSATPGKREPKLLAGIVYCMRDNCDTRMVGNGKSYRCNRTAGSYGGGCGKTSRNAESLDEHVVSEWVKHMEELTGSETLEYVHDPDEPDRAELQMEYDDIARRIDSARANYTAGRIGDEDFFPVIEGLRSRLAEVQAKLDREPKPWTWEGHEIDTIEVNATWRFAFDWAGHRYGRSAQRDLLKRSIDRIDVRPVTAWGSKRFDPATVDIKWKARI